LAIAAIGIVLPLLGAGGRRDYARSFKQATQELRLYQGFATALILRGTYLDDRFRTAMITERRRLLDPTEEDHQRFKQRMKDDGAAYHEVVFSAGTNGMDGADTFGDGDDGWRIRLLADGVAEPLVTVYRVRKPTPLHRTIYLHYNQWSDLWIARFARTTPAPNEVVLKIGSGYGNGELRWTNLQSQ